MPCLGSVSAVSHSHAHSWLWSPLIQTLIHRLTSQLTIACPQRDLMSSEAVGQGLADKECPEPAAPGSPASHQPTLAPWYLDLITVWQLIYIYTHTFPKCLRKQLQSKKTTKYPKGMCLLIGILNFKNQIVAQLLLLAHPTGELKFISCRNKPMEAGFVSSWNLLWLAVKTWHPLHQPSELQAGTFLF